MENFDDLNDMLEIKSENVHEITDDAIETMLMDDTQTSQPVPNTSNLITIQTNKPTVVSLPAEHNTSENRSQIQVGDNSKLVGTSHPTQMFTQHKVVNPVITKYVVKKSTASIIPRRNVVGNTNFSISQLPTLQQKGVQGLQTLTLQNNNLTLSPIKGGFKIPISPLKNSGSLKVSMMQPMNSFKPSNLTPATIVKPQLQTKFQFQTVLPNNTGSFQIAQKVSTTASFSAQQSVQVPAMGRNIQIVNANGIVQNSNLIQPQTRTVSIGAQQPQQNRRIQPMISVQTNQRQILQQAKLATHQRLIMPATTTAQNTSSIANLSPGTLLQAGNVGYAMVPAKYVEQLKKQINSQILYHSDQLPGPNVLEADKYGNSSQPQSLVSSKIPNGKVRKPCNCTKSMCLKLYCECFANGHFCEDCNCINCHNNLEYDGDRSKAIKSCLDRNPAAFRPKIGRGRDDNRTHQKGCNCKRSGCLKNYCECYEARIACTSKCKCIGCRNVDEEAASMEEQHPLMNLADAAAVRCQQHTAAKNKINTHFNEIGRSTQQRSYHANTGERLPCTFFTQEVIEATCTCLLAQAEEAEKTNLSIPVAERMIIEEFGKCLMQIIQAAGKAKTIH